MLFTPAHSATTSLSNGELCRRVEFVFPKKPRERKDNFRIGEFSRRKIKKKSGLCWRRIVGEEKDGLFSFQLLPFPTYEMRRVFFCNLLSLKPRTTTVQLYTATIQHFFSYIHGEINCVRALFLQKNRLNIFLSPRVFGRTVIASFVLLKKSRRHFSPQESYT